SLDSDSLVITGGDVLVLGAGGVSVKATGTTSNLNVGFQPGEWIIGAGPVALVAGQHLTVDPNALFLGSVSNNGPILYMQAGLTAGVGNLSITGSLNVDGLAVPPAGGVSNG